MACLVILLLIGWVTGIIPLAINLAFQIIRVSIVLSLAGGIVGVVLIGGDLFLLALVAAMA